MRQSPRILVTGAGGQVGRAILHSPAFSTAEIHAFNHRELDVTDESSLASALSAIKPDWVIHGAAMTGVDACEDDPVTAYRVNAFGAGFVARQCATYRARLVFLSTDYVFPGTELRAMEVWDPPAPLSVYGSSKWLGELLSFAQSQSVWVIRTSYVFYGRGPSLLSRLLERARSGLPLRLVTDQTIVPTFAPDLARALADLIQREPEPGIYHITGSTPTTPWEVGTAIADFARLSVAVEPILLQQLPQKAKRPRYSLLSCERALSAGLLLPRPWKEALPEFLAACANEG